MSRKLKTILTLGLLLSLTTGCASTPEPDATATSAPEVVLPSYDSEAASKPPFTINGTGSEDITIDLPAGFAEPSIITLSSNGEVTLDELNYDQESVGSTLIIRSENGGTAITVKYPTADTPARTSDFRVEAEDGVSWAISAEALGSVQKLSANSISGIDSQIFMLDGEANTIDFVTTGFGNSTIYLINLENEEPQKLKGGIDAQSVVSNIHTIDKSLTGFNGYIFFVSAENPDTQGWEVLFSQLDYAELLKVTR